MIIRLLFVINNFFFIYYIEISFPKIKQKFNRTIIYTGVLKMERHTLRAASTLGGFGTRSKMS